MTVQRESSGTPRRPVARPKKNNRSRAESIFLGTLIAVSLLSATFFVALTAWAVFVPAMGIAILTGIGVATLVYAFLGGGGDNFAIRGIQLAGAAAVFSAVVYIVNDALDRQLTNLAQIDRIRKSPVELLLETESPAQPISGGGTVKLIDVTSLLGWNEGAIVAEGGLFRFRHGDHSINKRRPEAKIIFTTIFRELDIQTPVEEVLKMSQREWEAFLADLPEDRVRFYVGGIPFASLEIRSSDDHLTRRIVFKNDEIPIQNGRGKTEAYLCIERILDVRKRSSNEREVVILSHSPAPCRRAKAQSLEPLAGSA